MAVRRRWRTTTKRIVAGSLIAGLALAFTPFEVRATNAAPVALSFPTQLTVGARGAQVAALQRALLAAGITVPGGADGVFGPATQNAVRTFQAQRGLAVTGVADQATLVALGLVALPPGTGAEASTGATRGQAGTPVAPTTTLSLGSQGSEVAAMQRALIAAGIAVRGGADGVFGPATREAVATFQRSQGLPATGAADPATQGALGLSTVQPTPGSSTTPPTTLPTTPATLFPTLQIGARGDDVARLQRALIGANIPVPGGADGSFGLATQGAVRTFQGQRGLPVTGVVDRATADALGLNGAPVTPTPAPSGDVVRIGAQGQTVRDIQNALIRAGIHVQGGADGRFGVGTQAAVRSFQSARGLPATGEVDAATRAALGLGGGTTPTPAPSGVLLRVGDRGPQVVRVQQALIDRGINVRGGADGIYGLATSAAVTEFQRNRGLSQTGNVDQATWDALDLSSSTPTVQAPTIEVFPMQGPCWFGDTWGAARSGGRRHEGVDIIGATGRYIYAVAAGTITRKYLDTPGSLSGNGLRLTMADGTYFFYAHFSEFAPGVEIGTKVVPGQIIGFNGATGNASVPHLHFEIHPGGGAAINPFPIVKAIDGCSRTEPLPQPGGVAPPQPGWSVAAASQPAATTTP